MYQPYTYICSIRYDQHDKGGSTPLHWAIDGGNIALIKWMLNDGADVHAVDINGWTPLLRAGMNM